MTKPCNCCDEETVEDEASERPPICEDCASDHRWCLLCEAWRSLFEPDCVHLWYSEYTCEAAGPGSEDPGAGKLGKRSIEALCRFLPADEVSALITALSSSSYTVLMGTPPCLIWAMGESPLTIGEVEPDSLEDEALKWLDAVRSSKADQHRKEVVGWLTAWRNSYAC